MIKKMLSLALLCLGCYAPSFGQDFLNKKLLKFQYMPRSNSKKTITAKIESKFKTKLGDTDLHWVKLTGDTVIGIWPNDMHKDIVIDSVFVFKGVKKLSHSFKK